MENNEIFEAEAEAQTVNSSGLNGQSLHTKAPDAFLAVAGQEQREHEPLLGQRHRELPDGKGSGSSSVSGQSVTSPPWYRTPSVTHMKNSFAMSLADSS